MYQCLPGETILGHPNLSRDLNLLLERGQDPALSLKLREVAAGDIVMIGFKDRDDQAESLLFIQIIKPAGQGWGEDSAKGVLAYAVLTDKWIKMLLEGGVTFPLTGQGCAITGSCSKNPDAPLGCTMLQLHAVTLGRELLWYTTEPKETAWLFWDTISRKAVLSAERFDEIKHNLELDAAERQTPPEADKVEMLRRQIEEERAILRGALRVTTRNSIYLLSVAETDGHRTLRKVGEDRVRTGTIDSLVLGHSLYFDLDDGRTWRTSTVVKIEPDQEI